MSSYVKYIHQCDICECALHEETHAVDDAPVKYPPQPVNEFGMHTCADCTKELHDAIETLKSVMQVKRATTEPAEELRFTKKEWGEIYAKQTEEIKRQVIAQRDPFAYDSDYGLKGSGMSSEKARFIMHKMREQERIQKTQAVAPLLKKESWT